MTDAELEAKAKRIQDVVEDHLVQDHGMLPMLVRAGDYRLPSADDYRGAYRHRHLQGKTEAESGDASDARLASLGEYPHGHGLVSRRDELPVPV